MKQKDRLAILAKIAQISNPSPTTVPGSPTDANIIGNFPTITVFGLNNIKAIENIADALNYAIFVLSRGQIDFNKLRLLSFNVDPGKYPDKTLSAIVRFSKIVFSKLLTTNGQAFKTNLTTEQKEQIVSDIATSLGSSYIPDGAINQFLATKIGGNLKEIIKTNLNTIK